MEKYTKEQIEDITTREAKGLKLLQELNLSPAAILYKINIGDDRFVDKVQPYLKDTKYTQKEDGTYEEVKTK